MFCKERTAGIFIENQRTKVLQLSDTEIKRKLLSRQDDDPTALKRWRELG
jgi:hypothetical protein